MRIYFVPIGTASDRPLKRYVLRFETQKALDEAVKINREEGFVQFRHEGVDLVGRIFRVAPRYFAIEVDAAKDSAEEVAELRRRRARAFKRASSGFIKPRGGR
ncbi:MAG: hypothetical protein ISN26_06835, partial [Betaproteobacteria bacterium AqS2]|nr:hypothetical protein [Betaproteobacteria bacterium AqS2]